MTKLSIDWKDSTFALFYIDIECCGVINRKYYPQALFKRYSCIYCGKII
jgi:hypothetical protein